MRQVRNLLVLSCLMLLSATISFQHSIKQLTRPVSSQQAVNHVICTFFNKVVPRKSTHRMAISTSRDSQTLQQHDLMFGAGLLSFAAFLFIQHDIFLFLMSGGIKFCCH